MHEAIHLALSLARRPGWARSPSVFRLRLRPARYTWLYAAKRAFASLNFTDHRLNGCAEQFQKGKIGASRKKRFYFSPMSTRCTNRCLSVATIALPIAAANQPGMPATPTLCKAAPAWPAATYALPFKRDVFFSGLDGRTGAFNVDVTPAER